MRRDIYGVYKGKEYRLVKKEDETFNLISNDPNDQGNGFTPYHQSVFLKNVDRLEIEDAYYIDTFCMYKGYRFQVAKERDGKVLIHTGDRSLQQVFQLDMLELGVYEKWVDKKELDNEWEEKSEVYNFPLK